MDAGLDPDLFWGLTPRQVSNEFSSLSVKNKRAMAERSWLAWHIAVLSRAEKIPPFDEFSNFEKPITRRSWEESAASAAAWVQRVANKN